MTMSEIMNCPENERKYWNDLNRWLFDHFLNTSAAQKNDSEWFERAIRREINKNRPDGKLPIIVGLCGQAGSGKDSAIEFFKRDPRFITEQYSFATPLKEIAHVYGFSKKQLTDRELKEKPDEFWGISPRQFLQMVGTEMFRKVWREDAWTKLAEKKIKSLMTKEHVVQLGFPKSTIGLADLIFITDVRFPNEVQCIKDLGGYVFRIERPNNANAISATHDSERFIKDLPVDAVIENDAPNSDVWSFLFATRFIQFFNHGAFYYD